MGTTQTHPWDAAAHLRTEDDMIAYLDAVLAKNDPELTIAALNDIVRAQGNEEVAADAGLNADEMSNSYDPRLASVLRVLDGLGLRLHVTPVSST